MRSPKSGCPRNQWIVTRHETINVSASGKAMSEIPRPSIKLGKV
jgi:hypothetical protein